MAAIGHHVGDRDVVGAQCGFDHRLLMVEMEIVTPAADQQHRRRRCRFRHMRGDGQRAFLDHALGLEGFAEGTFEDPVHFRLLCRIDHHVGGEPVPERPAERRHRRPALRLGQREAQRAEAAHRIAGDGTAVAVGPDRVMLLDPVRQILGNRGPHSAETRRRRIDIPGVLGIGHDDDHLGQLVLGDQRIRRLLDMALIDPVERRAVCAVQQIDHRHRGRRLEPVGQVDRVMQIMAERRAEEMLVALHLAGHGRAGEQPGQGEEQQQSDGTDHFSASRVSGGDLEQAIAGRLDDMPGQFNRIAGKACRFLAKRPA